MLIIELLLISFILYVSASLVYYTIKLGISPIPTSIVVRKHLLALVHKQYANFSVLKIAELGSGWGSLAIPIAKQFPAITVYAFEASFVPYWFARLRLLVSPQKNLVLMHKDFYNVPLTDFDMFVCYLYPNAMNKLRSKFEQELTKPAIIITHTFAIHGWTAVETKKVNDLHQTTIYAYHYS